MIISVHHCFLGLNMLNCIFLGGVYGCIHHFKTNPSYHQFGSPGARHSALRGNLGACGRALVRRSILFFFWVTKLSIHVWCLNMFHDFWSCFMIFDHVWSFLMIFDDFWSYLIIFAWFWSSFAVSMAFRAMMGYDGYAYAFVLLSAKHWQWWVYLSGKFWDGGQ